MRSLRSAAPRAARVAALLLFAGGCAEPPAARPADEPSVADKVRRLAAVLDYVAADYPGAVADGAVVSREEYEEQLSFLADAAGMASSLPPPARAPIRLVEGVDRVKQLVGAKAAGPEVAAAARGLRRELLAAYEVVLAPSAPPARERGQVLYAENCAACHGARGTGDGPRAADLKPPPRSFHDPAVMADLSPARAFNGLTDGIEGTAMASFGALAASDRWSLAFFVMSLRHDGAAATRGEEAYARAGRPVAATATRLAGMTDKEIETRLAGGGLAAADAADALAYLRGVAPFVAGGAPLDAARSRLAGAVAAYRAGDVEGARRDAAGAYLDGFEPHEGALRERDEALVTRVEQGFLALRSAMAERAPADRVEQRALVLGALLDSAEEALRGGGDRVAFASALVILLREGLEAALLILLLLALARRAGAGRDAIAVHAGWLAAVAVGTATWFAAGGVLAAIGGARRELVEGAVSLLAAVVLLAASHFVLARLDARRRVSALKDRLMAATSTSRRRFALASLAFVAVYREAFEVVLFLRAVMLDGSVSGWSVAGGAAAGAGLLVVLVVILGRLGNRLKPGPLLTAAGTLLCALAVVLAGKGVRSLQEAGVIGIHPLAAPRLDWLGLYPTTETMIAQAATLALFVGIAAWALLRARGAREAGAAVPAGSS